jgi:hypothetical protein
MKFIEAKHYPSLLLLFLVSVSCMIAVGQNARGAPDRQAVAPAQPQNPMRVALLRWYNANQTTSFAVGGQPYGVAFDGANIWTANLATAR